MFSEGCCEILEFGQFRGFFGPKIMQRLYPDQETLICLNISGWVTKLTHFSSILTNFLKKYVRGSFLAILAIFGPFKRPDSLVGASQGLLLMPNELP